MSKLARENAIIPLTPAEDHSAKRGYFVKNSSGNAALCTAVTDDPIGVIIDGETTSGKSAVAVADGLGGTVKVKLGASAGTVVLGTRLILVNDGSCKADTGSGARTQVARALESGANNELIEAVLMMPVALT